MRSPALALLLSVALISLTARSSSAEVNFTQSAQSAQNPSSSAAQQPAMPGQFILQDGTPIKLRTTRNVSSADATVGESVDFEVLEEVKLNGIAVIPKGGTAIGSVTEAVPKRR